MTMSPEERSAFLAEDGHVGVIAIEREGRAPLSVPLWYRYVPRGEVWAWIQRGSAKDVALREAKRFTLVAQSEEYPYRMRPERWLGADHSKAAG